MRAYPIIGCLHLSCYPRGRGYPIEQGGDFNKLHRQAAGRGCGGGAGQGRGECMCVEGSCRLHFQKPPSGRQVHQIGRFTFQLMILTGQTPA